MTGGRVFASILGLAAAGSVFAQHPTAPLQPSGSIAGRPSNSPLPSSNPTTSGPELARPFYISGKVTLDDGTPPPEPVSIQLVCNGNRRPIGFSDAKGGFDIDLNNRQNTAVYADSSQTDTVGRNGLPSSSPLQGLGRQQTLAGPNLGGCDLQASLAGFRSDRVSMTGQRSMESPEMGTIVLHRIANVPGTTVSVTSALAPEKAKKAFQKGMLQEEKEKWPAAEREFGKAVVLYPKFAAAWFHYGVAQQRQDNIVGARESYAKALAADAKYVSPYQQLAILATREQKWDQVAADTDHLLRMNPVDFPDAWLYNSLANFELRNMDAAEHSARQGLAMDGAHRYSKLHQVLGVILAEKHQYPEAAEHMRIYLRMAPDSADAELVRKQLARVESAINRDSANKNP